MRQRRTSPQFAEPIELEIHDLSHEGRGVGKHQGKTVFVTGALPGETVRAKRTEAHRQYDEAFLLEVLTASPLRIQPQCPHFGQCAGCVLQHLDAAEQIKAKERTLRENFTRIGHVEPETWLPALTGTPFHYRRRGRFSVRHVGKKGRALVGFRELNGKFVADITECHIVAPTIARQLPKLSELVSTLDAADSIPQIEFAAADNIPAFVFRHLNPLSDGDVQKLRDYAAREKVAVYLQPKGIDSVHALAPSDVELYFRVPEFDLKFMFQPLDFIQINGDINARMIRHALDLLEPQPTDRILDLFCGLGNFTLPLARTAATVVGVEGDAPLVDRARQNARLNGLTNTEFAVADLINEHRHAPWANERYDKILLDVSCHPGSLARDAGMLVRDHGFRLTRAGVMDMFPQTAHVESIAVFDR
ncbi:MAG: 23S rRNA (uracil(1939)-C(5))-methyltransferase RlmD [Ahniella sp.]|nr:23S rRNA (uracil(1939)-C(5))-methyltransferase RlmD [Ahniella sp.]